VQADRTGAKDEPKPRTRHRPFINKSLTVKPFLAFAGVLPPLQRIPGKSILELGIRKGNVGVMWEENVAAFESQEFIVGLAVAAILLSALVVSPLFRNVALALAAGAVVMLYLQGGVPNLLAISKTLEGEFLAIPDFSRGLMVGVAMAGVLFLGMRQRGSSSS
jgi:hypothetical protein